MPHTPFQSSPHTSNGKRDMSQKAQIPEAVPIPTNADPLVTLVFDTTIVISGVPRASLFNEVGDLVGSCVSAAIDDSGTMATLDFGAGADLGYTIVFDSRDPAIRTRLGAYITPAALTVQNASGSSPALVSKAYSCGERAAYFLFDQPINLTASTLDGVSANVFGVRFDGNANPITKAGPNTVRVALTATATARGEASRAFFFPFSAVVVAAFMGAPAGDLEDEAWDEINLPDDLELLYADGDYSVVGNFDLGWNAPLVGFVGGTDDIAFASPDGTHEIWWDGVASLMDGAVFSISAGLAERAGSFTPHTCRVANHAFSADILEPQNGPITDFPWAEL